MQRCSPGFPRHLGPDHLPPPGLTINLRGPMFQAPGRTEPSTPDPSAPTLEGAAQRFHEEALPHRDAVQAFARRLTGDPTEADDLTQETFLKAWRSWLQFTPGTSCRSWLFTICRNHFLRTRERRVRHRDLILRETMGGPARFSGSRVLPQPIRGPEAEFHQGFIEAPVRRALADLPKGYRDAVVLSDLRGMSYQEVADTLDVPVGTIRSRLSRGRRQLRARLEHLAREYGYHLATAG